MRHLVALVLFLLAFSPAKAQEFERLYSNSSQAVLSQPLQWVGATSAVAPSLPEAFAANPGAWAFASYTSKTALPTRSGHDVWLRFTLAATATPQSWVIRIPRLTIKKVGLYSMNINNDWAVQSAGSSIEHSAWNRNTRTPSFEVITGPLEKTYFFRFEHYTAVTERPELMSQNDFMDGTARVGMLLGLMLGMFGMLMLACIAAYIVARNIVFLYLGAFVIAVLLHFLVLMGFGGWRIWPGNAHLSQAMQWAAPLLTLAAGCSFFARASYAKDTHKSVYRALNVLAIVCLALGLFKLVSIDFSHRDFLNAWTLVVLSAVVMALLWLSWRGMRWNLWLLAGLVPIASAGGARLAQNYGLQTQVEFSLAASLFLTQLGLGWLLAVLVWRSRAALLASGIAEALNNLDATTGLCQQRVALIRLPQMLNRASHLKLGCGVVMLRWLNYAQLMGTLSAEKQNAMRKHFGLVLNRAARDIDTAARLENDHFLILVEGPVSRQALSSLCTQILTTCLRASDKFGVPNGFSFHTAIWQAGPVPMSASEVIESLKSRLHQMSSGTRRPVQFVDAMTSELTGENGNKVPLHRDRVIAKIDAIEASPSVQAVLRPE